MSIELSKEDKQQAINSIQRWFETEREESIGNIGAMGLLSFFLEDIGPIAYNQAVADVQERLRARVDEIDLEVHEDAFQYWAKFDKPKR